MALKGYTAFPKTSASLEPHYKIFCFIIKTLVGGALLLRRDTVDVFCSPCRMGHGTLVGEVLTLTEDTVDVFCSLSSMGHRTLVRGVLPSSSDAVGIFCSLSRMGHRTLVGGNLTPLQIYSRCILQPQPYEPLDTR